MTFIRQIFIISTKVLAPNDKAKELEKLVEHTINVKGTVTKDAEVRNVLTITEYQEAFN